MKKLFSQIVAAGAGIWLATIIVPGVKVTLLPDSNFFGMPLTATWELFVLFGIILGLLNYFVRPILKVLALPLEIITLGLFSFVINIGMIWAVDVIFQELTIPFWIPLLYTSFIIWGIYVVLSLLLREK